MVLVPIVVKNQDELEKASKLKRDVIIVKNQELFEAIQKQKKKLNRKKVGNNLEMKTNKYMQNCCRV